MSLTTPPAPQQPAQPLAVFICANADALDAALPQTQCTRCGYPDCRSYAEAIAAGQAAINQCPPGGQEGVRRLARLTGQPETALSPAHGAEGPRLLARIDENWCIGCTLCIKACPTDAILGANKLMHTVIDAACTGCELCVPVCPVDCIALEPASGRATGWDAWSPAQAAQARRRYLRRKARLEPPASAPPSSTQAPAPGNASAKQAALAAILAKARQRR